MSAVHVASMPRAPKLARRPIRHVFVFLTERKKSAREKGEKKKKRVPKSRSQNNLLGFLEVPSRNPSWEFLVGS